MKLRTALFILLCICFARCKKQAGEGGTSTIRGTIRVEDWNTAFTIKNGEYAGADEDVYIIYGDDTGYGDKTKANYKGEFEFKYLRKGKYTVYAYSKDKSLSAASGDTSVVKEITVSKNKTTYELETITIFN